MKKAYRVKKNEELQKILAEGKRVANRRFALYYHPAAFDHDRIGISAGRKLGNAVVRNRVKRQVRMMLQEICDFRSGYDYILIVRQGYMSADYATNKNDLSVLYNSVYNNMRTN